MNKVNYHSRQELMISPQTSALIKKTKILVVGVGAGGNEVLKNLLLMGFGNFTIIDFDTVEDSNLSRTTLFRKEDIGKSKSLIAAQRLKELALHENPCIVGLHGNLMTDFGKGLFMEHDIVVSCVDTQKCRAYINDWCVRTKTPFFEMGFERYNVNVSFFAPTGKMMQKDGKIIEKLPSDDGFFPTFLEGFPVCLREEIGVGEFGEKRNSCSGHKVKDVQLAKIPTIQVAASMAGTLIATEIVKFLSGIDSIRNKMLFFSGISYETLPVGYNRNPKCTIHDDNIPIEELPTQLNPSLKELLQSIEEKYSSTAMLKLLDSFVLSGECHGCGKKLTFNKRSLELYDEDLWCDDCKAKLLNEDVNFFDASRISEYTRRIQHPSNLLKVPSEISLNLDDEILNYHINDIGIPDNDIIKCMVIKDNSCLYKYIWLKHENS